MSNGLPPTTGTAPGPLKSFVPDLVCLQVPANIKQVLTRLRVALFCVKPLRFVVLLPYPEPDVLEALLPRHVVDAPGQGLGHSLAVLVEAHVQTLKLDGAVKVVDAGLEAPAGQETEAQNPAGLCGDDEIFGLVGDVPHHGFRGVAFGEVGLELLFCAARVFEAGGEDLGAESHEGFGVGWGRLPDRDCRG